MQIVQSVNCIFGKSCYNLITRTDCPSVFLLYTKKQALYSIGVQFSVQEFSISLRSFQDIQDFVAIATVQPFQVLVGNAHQKINGKSFMGMCTLDCRWPLDVTFQSTDEDAERFRLEAARFLA